MREWADTASFGKAAPSQGGWSNRELREIDRIRAACGNHLQLEMALGESDEGDPWCVISDRERILLHIARIDRCYVIARPCRSRLQTATSIRAAADLALSGLDREMQEHASYRCDSPQEP